MSPEITARLEQKVKEIDSSQLISADTLEQIAYNLSKVVTWAVDVSFHDSACTNTF